MIGHKGNRRVLGYREKQGKPNTEWVTLGHAQENPDGSLVVTLDALPINGKLYIANPNN